VGSSGCDQEWKIEGRGLEWCNMELTVAKTKRTASRRQRGISLIELMIAMAVLMVGVLGSMVPVVMAIGANGRNRQQSNSTVIAQMIEEKIMSVPASQPQVLQITDCTGVAQNINTAGAAAPGAGAALANGMADYSQALNSAGAPAGYYVLYTNCGTNGRQSVFDVRWNIVSVSPFVNLVTVSAKLRGNGTDLKTFSFPVTIRSMAGQGS
jgi:Tfp pilus assembly protein PilV